MSIEFQFTLSGVGHFGSNSSLQRERFKIQPKPGIVSTRYNFEGSELVCSYPWSFHAETQYKLVSSSNSLKVCEKQEKKSAMTKKYQCQLNFSIGPQGPNSKVQLLFKVQKVYLTEKESLWALQKSHNFFQAYFSLKSFIS